MSRLLLLDYDGTLCDTHDAIVHALDRLFVDRIGLSIPGETLIHRVRLGRPLDETVLALHPEPGSITDDAMPEWETHYRAIYAETAPARSQTYDGAVQTVRACAELATVVVVTQKSQAEVEHSLVRHGFAPFVRAAFGDLPGRPRKPDAALFRDHIAPAAGDFDLARVLMVGDTPGDLRFARDAGLKSCWATYGYGHDEACRDVGFDMQIAGIGEVVERTMAL